MQKAIAKTEITSASVARGTDRVSHEVYYVVQSNTQANTWYQCRWSNERTMWQCNCPAGSHGRPCCHLAAVQEVLKIRRATIAAAMGPDTVAVVARMQRDEDRKLAEAARREAFVQANYIYE